MSRPNWAPTTHLSQELITWLTTGNYKLCPQSSVKFLLPDVWLSLSLHEPIHETLLLLNHRPPFFVLNEVLCRVSFRIEQQLSVMTQTYIAPISIHTSLQRLCLHSTTEFLPPETKSPRGNSFDRGSKPPNNNQPFLLRIIVMWQGSTGTSNRVHNWWQTVPLLHSEISVNPPYTWLDKGNKHASLSLVFDYNFRTGKTWQQ